LPAHLPVVALGSSTRSCARQCTKSASSRITRTRWLNSSLRAAAAAAAKIGRVGWWQVAVAGQATAGSGSAPGCSCCLCYSSWQALHRSLTLPPVLLAPPVEEEQGLALAAPPPGHGLLLRAPQHATKGTVVEEGPPVWLHMALNQLSAPAQQLAARSGAPQGCFSHAPSDLLLPEQTCQNRSRSGDGRGRQMECRRSPGRQAARRGWVAAARGGLPPSPHSRCSSRHGRQGRAAVALLFCSAWEL
jgi:hypothetical protein